jgi:hypothetical protein
LKKKITQIKKEARKRTNHKYVKNHYSVLRLDIINHYGGKCAFCGDTNTNHLCIDHINNDGAEHRRKMGIEAGTGTYRWLKKNNYPDGFQVLCHNHNAEKRYYNTMTMPIYSKENI